MLQNSTNDEEEKVSSESCFSSQRCYVSCFHSVRLQTFAILDSPFPFVPVFRTVFPKKWVIFGHPSSLSADVLNGGPLKGCMFLFASGERPSE